MTTRRPDRGLHTLFKLLREGRRAHLAGAIQLLQLQVEILRSRLPGRIRFTQSEKRQLRLHAKLLGDDVAEFLLVVLPQTCERWGRADDRVRTGRRGRPRKSRALEEIVVRLASENDWGCTRIFAELRKLGLAGRISRTTVREIMRRHGFDPDPRRGPGTWHEFVTGHLQTLWACDFFSKPVQTPLGLQEQHVLFFKHLGSRRVFIAGATANPTMEWTAQQTRNFCMHVQDLGLRATHLIHDRDTRFRGPFCSVLAGEGIEDTPIPVGAPEMNGYAESFVKTIKRECLDHFLIFSQEHLVHVLREFETYYNTVRPHRGIGNRPIGEIAEPAARDDEVAAEDLVCDERLGGRLRHYRWKCAA